MYLYLESKSTGLTVITTNTQLKTQESYKKGGILMNKRKLFKTIKTHKRS